MNQLDDQVKKGAAVVVFNNHQVLLIKSGVASGHADGVYSLPSGSVDNDETYIETAAREFNEESGLTTDVRYLVQLPTFYEATLERKDGLKKFCAWSYYCTKYWGDLKTSDEGEPVWVDIDKLNDYHLQVNVDKMIAEALSYVKDN